MLGIVLELKDHAVRFGPGRASRYFAWRVADRLAGYMPYQGFLLPASRARGRNAFAPNGFVCREVALQELAPYTSDSAYDLSERFLSDARARADCCIGLFAGEKLVSYSFNSRVPTNIDSGFRYEFPEGWVYRSHASLGRMGFRHARSFAVLGHPRRQILVWGRAASPFALVRHGAEYLNQRESNP